MVRRLCTNFIEEIGIHIQMGNITSIGPWLALCHSILGVFAMCHSAINKTLIYTHPQKTRHPFLLVPQKETAN